MAVNNSFLLYTRIKGKKSINLKDFKCQIALTYLKLGMDEVLWKVDRLAYHDAQNHAYQMMLKLTKSDIFWKEKQSKTYLF